MEQTVLSTSGQIPIVSDGRIRSLVRGRQEQVAARRVHSSYVERETDLDASGVTVPDWTLAR